jgi:hypothetical protein
MLVEDELCGAGAEVVGPALSVGGALRLIGAVSGYGGLSAAVLDIDLEGEHLSPVADLLATFGAPFLFATGHGEDCDTGGHADARVPHERSLGARWSMPSRRSHAPGGGTARACACRFSARWSSTA